MNILKSLVAVASAMAFCLALAGCGGSDAQAPESSAAPSEAASSAASAGAPASDASAVEADFSAADLANVDIEIAYGDFEAMGELSGNAQSAKASGSVVQVEGLVVNYGPGMSCSIVEPNADGSKRIGMVFKIAGASEDAYPADGQRVRITGLVDTDESGYSYFIKTLPEFVEVM